MTAQPPPPRTCPASGPSSGSHLRAITDPIERSKAAFLVEQMKKPAAAARGPRGAGLPRSKRGRSPGARAAFAAGLVAMESR